jgi:A/G-specific adenine glycosylase
MDHGATICLPINPRCNECPVAKGCTARSEGLIELLPAREKRIVVKTRFFNYMLLRFDDQLWIHRRNEKDIWRGLYEPLLIESREPCDRKTLKSQESYKSLGLKGDIDFEGELQQRLTHQVIRARFFQISLHSFPALPIEGNWISLGELQEFAFPSVLNTFFQKKNYF